tara:strand:- start:912 stop:1637 length:726 start_codon:yes stop_codon:yes gene_type:complete
MQIINKYISSINREIKVIYNILICGISIFKREYLLTYRNFYNLLTIIVFFVLGILIFIFAIGPEKELNNEIGIAIIWTLLLLSTNLSIRKFYQEDFNDGSIILFFISGISLEFLVILKILTAWLFFHFPFVVIIPIISFLLNVENEKIITMLLTFLVGSPILASLSSIAGSMNLLNDKNFTIGSNIIMLFSIPLIIFSVGIINEPQELMKAQLNILLGILMLSLAITPWVSAICIRIAIRN